MGKQDYRAVLGERLKSFREDRGISLYAVAKKGGIQIGQVKAIESGNTNYTIDVFLGYITGSDLYMYFAEKDNTEEVSDIEELAKKGLENDPMK